MRRALPLSAAAAAGALLLALALALTGGDRVAATTTWQAPDGAYSIAAPRGWEAVASGAAATVLRRRDDRGVVVIRRHAGATGPLDRLAGRLQRRLRARLADFEPAGARLTAIGGGQGLIYTFVRPAANQVQSVVVAPSRSGAYTLDLVADGDAPDVARELAGMVRSFTPRR